MIVFGDTLLSITAWIMERFGIKIDFLAQEIVDSLEEHEVTEQLQYGRD